jgi:hypothetical protein
VVLVGDTFRPDLQPLAIKVLKRQFSYAGQKASALAHCAAACAEAKFQKTCATC